jgi:hypothetical protein
LQRQIEMIRGKIETIALTVLLIALPITADQMTHKFKSPSFSGANTSSHYLTIENQEFNRKADIADEIKA